MSDAPGSGAGPPPDSGPDRSDGAPTGADRARPSDPRLLLREVIDDVDTSLRHLLRDLPDAPESVRVRALAASELSPPDVVAELRRHERISIPLAASLHELFHLRERLEQGAEPSASEVELALLASDQLEQEILELRPTPPAAAPRLSGEPHAVEPQGAPARRGWRSSWVGFGLSLLVLLLALGTWWAQRPADRAQLDQGVALFRTGSYADAAHHFFRYAQANPDDPVPHLYLARIHRRMGRPELAAEELRLLSELAPDDPAVQRELGFFLLDAGRHDAAVERFRAAVEADPQAVSGWVGLARALRAAGRPDAADRVLERAPAEVRETISARAAAAPPSANP